MRRLFTASPTHSLPNRIYSTGELFLGALLLLGLGSLLSKLITQAANWWLAYAAYGLISLFVLAFWAQGPLGWANRITLFRAVLIALVAGALADDTFTQSIWLWLVVATVALLLDGVDGWVARRTQSFSAFGARFDTRCPADTVTMHWPDTAGVVRSVGAADRRDALSVRGGGLVFQLALEAAVCKLSA